MAKSNMEIDIVIKVPRSYLLLTATFENQFELLYLIVPQKHDLRILANYTDVSRRHQAPATITAPNGKTTFECNAEFTESAIMLLSRMSTIGGNGYLNPQIRFVANKLEINFNAPEHVCNILDSMILSESLYGTEALPIRNLNHMIFSQNDVNTPSTSTEA